MSFGFGFGLAPTVAAPHVEEAETPLTLLFQDTFVGSSGLLSAHDPTGEIWLWDNWQVGGHSGVAWSLSGSNTVSQTDYPTAGEGIRSYFAYIQAPSNEPLVKATFTSPSETQWANGVIARMSDATNYWTARLNARNDRLELVRVQSGSENVEQFASFTTAENTTYTVELECVGNTLVARCGATVTATETNTFNQSKTRVGLAERVALNGGHGIFSSFSVEHAPGASATASRIFYCPAAAGIAFEFDGAADESGTSGTNHDSVNDVFALEITATGAENPPSGVRLDCHFDDTGQTPSKKDDSAVKNIPDVSVHRCYYWIPLTERVGSFWLLWQMKQRLTTMETIPLIAFNLGWNGSQMVTEINNNIDTDGSYNGAMPDLSTVNYVFPASEWVQCDFYYKWHATDGRFAMWMNGDLIYDFNHIRTMLVEPPENLDPVQFDRSCGPGHYAEELEPNTVEILVTRYAVSVPSVFGELLPKEV